MTQNPQQPESSSETSASPEPSPPPPPTEPQSSPDNVRTWGMLCHLTALAGLIGVPLGNIVGPLVVWLIKKDEMPLVDVQGRKSLNWQLTMLIAGIISGVLMVIVIGFLLLAAVVIVDLIFVILGSVKVSKGEEFDYPFSIKFLK